MLKRLLCLLLLGCEAAARFLSGVVVFFPALVGVGNTAMACLGLAPWFCACESCCRVMAALIREVPNAGVNNCLTIWLAPAGVSNVADVGGGTGLDTFAASSIEVLVGGVSVAVSSIELVVDRVSASVDTANAVTCGGVASSSVVFAALLLLLSTGPVGTKGAEAFAWPAWLSSFSGSI